MMMNFKPARLALLVLSAALLTAALPADPATAGERWYLGLESVSSHIGTDDLTDEDIAAGAISIDEVGRGGGFYAGYRFSPRFSLRLHVTASVHETADPDLDLILGGSLFEGVYHFTPERPFCPYLTAGFGGYILNSQTDQVEIDVTGPASLVGVGFFYKFGRHIGLDFSASAAFINWKEQVARIKPENGPVVEIETPVEGSGVAARFGFGVGWWF